MLKSNTSEPLLNNKKRIKGQYVVHFSHSEYPFYVPFEGSVGEAKASMKFIPDTTEDKVFKISADNEIHIFSWSTVCSISFYVLEVLDDE